MPLKYQSEIDGFELTECPVNIVAFENEVESFRFSYEPIDHDMNFLPNVVFDKAVNAPFNYDTADNARKCLRCGASFYNKIESAVSTWNNLTQQIKENLGYTHIAKGNLDNEDGVISNLGTNCHFTF